MILAVANTKGGSGKTTLATNIAVARALAGRDVLLVDADSQGSAADFTALRTETLGEAGYSLARLLGREVRTEVAKLAKRFDDTVIDVGGRDNESLRAALVVADAVLIPVLPSSFDVWSFSTMVGLAREAQAVNDRLSVLAVLNAADAQGQDNDDARELIRETDGVDLLPCQIGRRKAYRNAAAGGRSVLDSSPKDPKAVAEINALVAAIFGAR
jgi:chromosome partitioning protein